MTPRIVEEYARPYIFVTQWFPPEPAGVPVALQDAIQELGLSLSVVTGIPNYPSGTVHSGYKAWKVYRDACVWGGLLRVPVFPSHSASKLGRVANYGSFALSSSVFALRQARDSQGVFVYGSPVTAGLMPLMAKRFFGTPYLVFVEDLWPDSLLESTMAPQGAIGRGVRAAAIWFSDLVYRNADHLVAITQGMASELEARGNKPERISVVMNWARQEFNAPLVASGRLRAHLALTDDELVLLYAGNLGSTHDLGNWIRAVDQVSDTAPVSLVFIGHGAAREELEYLARDLRCNRVYFMDSLEEDDFIEMFADADAVVVSLRRSSGLDTAMPSKIPFALAAGKITLASVDGDAAEAVRLGGGIVTEDGSVDSIVLAIGEFVATKKEERVDRSWQAIRHYAQNMSRDHGKVCLSGSIIAAFRETGIGRIPATQSLHSEKPTKQPEPDQVVGSSGTGNA